jgi:tetraacyldisaccharide 4'-kinase
VVVVGNVSVGGVGKTPLVIALAQNIQAKGLRVGIVSRGYRATIKQFPYQVNPDDLASDVGDEPLLLAQKAKCPVVIAPKRPEAIEYLVTHHNCQIIISDDGLQHYRMARAIEIAVIDGTRGVGNGLCLPVGPLREPASRLREVDFVVVNEGNWERAYPMSLVPDGLFKLKTMEPVALDKLSADIVAVAAIGNPDRFYTTLRQLGLKFKTFSFADHHQFKPKEFDYGSSMVIMTEKDAVKCRSFCTDTMFFLPIKAVLNDAFWEAFWSHQQLKGYC